MRRVLERLGPGTAQRLEGLSIDERFLWASGPIETLRRFADLIRPPHDHAQPIREYYADRLRRLVLGRVTFLRDGHD
jgi:hypothetical protein